MRHFLHLKPLVLPVLALADGMRESTVEAILILASRPQKTLPPRRIRTNDRAVPMPPIAGATQGEYALTSRALSYSKLFHGPPTAPNSVDKKARPWTIVSGWSTPRGRTPRQPGDGYSPGCRLSGWRHIRLGALNSGKQIFRRPIPRAPQDRFPAFFEDRFHSWTRCTNKGKN